MKNTAELLDGRILHIDVAAGYNSVSDVDDMTRTLERICAGVHLPNRVVIVADWRGCHLFTPEVAERIPTMFRSVHTKIERSGILHNENQATTVLQMVRLIREAQFPDRKVFTQPTEMAKWLGEVLTDAHKARVNKLLKV